MKYHIISCATMSFKGNSVNFTTLLGAFITVKKEVPIKKQSFNSSLSSTHRPRAFHFPLSPVSLGQKEGPADERELRPVAQLDGLESLSYHDGDGHGHGHENVA